MNKILKTIIAVVLFTLALVACEKEKPVTIQYLDVTANNISGSWEVVEWNGAALEAGTYVYIDIVRNDGTFTLYQNVNSFSDIPDVITGRYHIETDENGAVIRGQYDHDSGDWAHRYYVKDLTATEMTWVAKDNVSEVQKFVRVESIPVAE